MYRFILIKTKIKKPKIIFESLEQAFLCMLIIIFSIHGFKENISLEIHFIIMVYPDESQTPPAWNPLLSNYSRSEPSIEFHREDIPWKEDAPGADTRIGDSGAGPTFRVRDPQYRMNSEPVPRHDIRYTWEEMVPKDRLGFPGRYVWKLGIG